MSREKLTAKQMDKLVIRFSKALDMELGKEKLPQQPCDGVLGGPWMTLGYFDTMQIYPLPVKADDSNWLQAIWSHNIRLSEMLDGHYYIHPFHIMADLSANKKRMKYDTFWARKTSCLFITLTQGKKVCPEESTPGNRSYSDLLEKDICDQLKKKKDDVTYVCYRTLELSDLVIIWKSDSMAAILQRIQDLYYQPFVGDLNTFCGIGYDALEKAAKPPAEDSRDDDIRIHQVAMRFIVKDVNRPREVFEKMKADIEPQPYFVTGTEDLHVIWTDIKERDFFRALYHCFFEEEVNEVFRTAFREVETHIGIPDVPCPPVPVPQKESNSELTEQCEKIFNEFCALKPPSHTPDTHCDYSWMKSVRSQLNVLLDMSRSYVVDGLCYLTLDSVGLFCEKVGEMLTIQEPLTSKQIEGIQRYIRGWGILTEQAGRADGRFTQLPGFSPPLYDIPSTLLEFYLAFSEECGRVLRSGDDSSKFAMLIVPKLCRRIKVESVFNQDPPCDRVLYVDIPLDTLYDPFAVLCQLAHEMSHFCGAEWRDRDNRADYFLTICAYELAAYLTMDVGPTIEEIKKELQQKCHYPGCTVYLDALKENACTAILTLLNDEDKFAQWMQITEKNLPFKDMWENYTWKNYCIAQRAILLNSWSNGFIYQTIDQVNELFAECYADVSMICVLGLSMEEYLRLAEKEIGLYAADVEEWARSADNDRKYLEAGLSSYFMIVQRWALVCISVFKAYSYPQSDCAYKKNFYAHLQACMKYIQQGSGEKEKDTKLTEKFLNIDTLSCLSKYLRSCNYKIKDSIPENGIKSETLKRLKCAFNKIAREHVVGCSSCSHMIAQYENRLRKRS